LEITGLVLVTENRMTFLQFDPVSLIFVVGIFDKKFFTLAHRAFHTNLSCLNTASIPFDQRSILPRARLSEPEAGLKSLLFHESDLSIGKALRGKAVFTYCAPLIIPPRRDISANPAARRVKIPDGGRFS
jgi:hypothetical protein